jgi:outer membrane protein assembly factor BamC
MFVKQLSKVALAVALTATVLSGCQTVTEMQFGKRIDYKSAAKAPPLEIPPDLTAPQYDDRYAVTSASELANRDLRAEARQKSVLPETENTKLVRAGTERWIVANTTPDKAWEILRDFWIDLGFVFAEENPMVGVMETDWAENRADIPNDLFRRTVGKYLDFFYSTDKRDKFRTRIEKGTEPGTVEIYVSHRGMEQVPTTKIDSSTPAAFAWALMPPDPNLEAEILMRIMVRFGAEQEKAVQQITAKVEPQQERAQVVKDGDSVKLVMSDDFDRAWRRVGLALDRVGFTVTDRNRQQGVYYVRYANPDLDIAKAEDDNSWLGKLAFWRSNSKEVHPENYQVNVSNEGAQNTAVRVTAEDVAIKQADIEEILNILKEQLK